MEIFLSERKSKVVDYAYLSHNVITKEMLKSVRVWVCFLTHGCFFFVHYIVSDMHCD